MDSSPLQIYNPFFSTHQSSWRVVQTPGWYRQTRSRRWWSDGLHRWACLCPMLPGSVAHCCPSLGDPSPWIWWSHDVGVWEVDPCMNTGNPPRCRTHCMVEPHASQGLAGAADLCSTWANYLRKNEKILTKLLSLTFISPCSSMKNLLN